ncbi:ATP-binding protein [Cupriavidus taiwanensis]|uniref:NACHT domain-containing protein n=1 Tax=Cupriavidus taiwanensis TaxID=164546 RepID=UPI00254015D6|nr:ATP-binding protein [Cupriavidus taiwanensis]MDK3022618.1 ATP-binding protein [Cupriavidus taiwanensis]
MQLPDIDFASIRLHRKSQPSAFEELCCQLASDEELDQERVSFIRKGLGGDGGIECFATLSDGTETGWQVKYYWDIASAISSLDESLNKALVKHPKMTRFIACLPFDLSDSRRDDVKTALERWTTWKDKRIANAASSGRQIEIDRWDAFELKKRLTASTATAAGRVAYWFGQSLLTSEWFRSSFERARAGLGERYSPENHVDLPIRRVIEATALDTRLYKDLADFSEAIAQSLARTNMSDSTAVNACEAAARELAQAAEVQGKPIFVAAVREAVSVARDAVLPWDQTQRNAFPPDHPNPQASAIANLSSTLNSIARELAFPHWDHVGTRALLVVGEAGSGKSHLLADVCDHAIEGERPAVMVLSGKLPDAEPWAEILKDLGLPRDLLPETFLGALNAAGQALGVRALVMIDALNEKNGRAIWPERLAGLVHDVGRFEWISLVLSCRSTYEQVVIPEELNSDRLPRVKHEGFSERQARQYLKKRGISLGEEPNSAEEFETPLFLRICCDALALDGQTVLTHSLGGVTEIFNLYTKAIVNRVNKQIGATAQRRFVERAISTLAQEMADTGREEVLSSRAYDLISEFFPAVVSAEEDILFQLQNEGLLSAQPSQEDKDQEEYRFTFQRMSDHAIASSLLHRSIEGGNVVAAFSGDTAVRRAMADAFWPLSAGVLEALAVQLPERFGVELNDMPDLSDVWGVSEAFEASLLTRNPKSLSNRTWELIEQVGGNELRYETLVALSTDPGQDHNAEYLDGELRGMSMPQRDAIWSTHLATNRRATERLTDWVREADQLAIHSERASLAGLQLCWFLTASDRLVRDTATKALVVLLAGRPKLAEALWTRFKSLDDSYVTERLVAAIYGASMQGRWSAEDLSSLVMVIHSDILVSIEFPANILTRGYALGLIHFAKSKAALPDSVDASPANLTFRSPWPIEYVTEAQIESYERTYRGNSRHHDEIVSSTVFDGDFARYQIDPTLRDCSVATKASGKVPTDAQLAQDWLDRFRSNASQEMLAAHDALVSAMSEGADRSYAEKRDIADRAKSAFRAAVGEEVYAQWSAEASNWRQSGMFQQFGNRRDAPAGFNLAWARRWVCKRAHDLGWSEALHGAFDSSIRNDRNTHQVERIGKKYQWIAFYELCARMADNLQPLPGRDAAVDVLRLRNIDPSLLVARTEDDGWRRFEEPSFWVPPQPELPPIALDAALEWLGANVDYVDGEDNIEVTNPTDDKHWLVLKGFESWRGGSKSVKLDTWRRIACFVVRKRDLKKTLDLIKHKHFQADDDVPSARSAGFHSYLGEHPWSWRTGDEKVDDEWIKGWSPLRFDDAGRVSIRPTTAAYLAESGSYDASITQTINLNLPAAWLMDGLGLHLTDGETIRYVDKDQVVRFMDPSVAATGRSAALIDREAFLSFLKKENLVAVWALAGEKNVYGEASRGFGGRWTYTRIFHSLGSKIVALERYQTHDAPDDSQLAALRAAAANIDNNDNDDDADDDWTALADCDGN